MTDLQKVAEAYACSAVDIEHLQRFKGTLAYELLNTGFLAGATYREAEIKKLEKENKALKAKIKRLEKRTK